MCALLLRYHADVSAKTMDDKTPLHIATLCGHQEVVDLLLTASKSPSLINQGDSDGMTPLHYATKRGDERMVQLLLLRGANPAVSNCDGESSFSFCAESSMFELLREHLENRFGSHSLSMPTKTTSMPVMLPELPVIQQEPATPMSPSPRDLSLSDFRAVGVLGKGEFGEVFLVERRQTGVRYAMKSVCKGRDLKSYLQTERNVLAKLNHPFIVRLHWAFQSASHLYLVVDYCPCGDLNELLQREGRLSEDVARFYISEIVLAVEALHREDVMYRDLKPENIVLDAEGHIRLTDFGLAKADMPASAMTRSFCGPLAYFPPEMVRQQSHGQGVDWYMLGCLVYEMLVGVPPFHSREQSKLFRKIENGRLKFPTWISPEAKDFVKRLLHIDTEQRLGKHGSSEVRSHQFFDGVDWDRVLRKEVRPPLTLPRKHPLSLMGRKVYGVSKEDKAETHVSGWTFTRDT